MPGNVQPRPQCFPCTLFLCRAYRSIAPPASKAGAFRQLICLLLLLLFLAFPLTTWSGLDKVMADNGDGKGIFE